MIQFDWKGKIGYGDIISPLCYAHALAQRNCDDVHFTMHWKHKRGEKFKDEDPETLDVRFKHLFKIARPITYHKVTYSQHFGTDMDYNHSNYDDKESFHNLWWSKIGNVDSNRNTVVFNTTATHKEQFKDYDTGKQWKDPVGLKGWQQCADIVREEWGLNVDYVDYTTPIMDAVDIYKKCFLAVGYHGSSMWLARYLGCPMLIYSTKPITRKGIRINRNSAKGIKFALSHWDSPNGKRPCLKSLHINHNIPPRERNTCTSSIYITPIL